MAGHRVVHPVLTGPSVVKELVIGFALGLGCGLCWKKWQWEGQRRTKQFYEMLEREEISIVREE